MSKSLVVNSNDSAPMQSGVFVAGDPAVKAQVDECIFLTTSTAPSAALAVVRGAGPVTMSHSIVLPAVQQRAGTDKAAVMVATHRPERGSGGCANIELVSQRFSNITDQIHIPGCISVVVA